MPLLNGVVRKQRVGYSAPGCTAVGLLKAQAADVDGARAGFHADLIMIDLHDIGDLGRDEGHHVRAASTPHAVKDDACFSFGSDLFAKDLRGGIAVGTVKIGMIAL